MFSLQEYQHVHLLCFKKRSFTLVWKPNPPLRSVRCAHLCARADAASESTMGARCSRSAYAPLLCCLCSAYFYGVWNQALLKRSHVISEIFLLLQCAAAGMHSHLRPRQIFTAHCSQVSEVKVQVKSQVSEVKSKSSLKSLKRSPSQVLSLWGGVQVRSQVFVLFISNSSFS